MEKNKIIWTTASIRVAHHKKDIKDNKQFLDAERVMIVIDELVEDDVDTVFEDSENHLGAYISAEKLLYKLSLVRGEKKNE